MVPDFNPCVKQPIHCVQLPVQCPVSRLTSSWFSLLHYLHFPNKDYIFSLLYVAGNTSTNVASYNITCSINSKHGATSRDHMYSVHWTIEYIMYIRNCCLASFKYLMCSDETRVRARSSNILFLLKSDDWSESIRNLNTSSLRFHTYTHTYQLYNNNVIKGACTLYTHTSSATYISSSGVMLLNNPLHFMFQCYVWALDWKLDEQIW